VAIALTTTSTANPGIVWWAATAGSIAERSHVNRKYFLLDEPLSNLDAQLRDDTRAELKQLHHQLGITTVYVTMTKLRQ